MIRLGRFSRASFSPRSHSLYRHEAYGSIWVSEAVSEHLHGFRGVYASKLLKRRVSDVGVLVCSCIPQYVGSLRGKEFSQGFDRCSAPIAVRAPYILLQEVRNLFFFPFLIKPVVSKLSD